MRGEGLSPECLRIENPGYGPIAKLSDNVHLSLLRKAELTVSPA